MGMHNLAIYSSPISEKSIGEFIYRPSGPVEGNFYDDWSKLVADLNADVHSRKTVYFDESYNLVIVPAGTWALNDDIEFRNFGPANEYTTVQFDDGCVIDGVRRFTGIHIYSNSTSPVFTFGSVLMPVEHVHLERTIVSGLASPVFHIEDECTVLFYFEYRSKFQGNPVISIGDFGFVEFRLFSWSAIEQSTISSAFATSSFEVARDASSNFILPQNGISHSDTLIDGANKVNYTDNTFTGPLLNATNVQGAIDALKYHPKAVANLPALEALPIVWPIQHGYQIWVSSLKTFYRYSSTPLTVDGIVYVTSASAGTWVRELEYHDRFWQENVFWYLDPVNGDDRAGTFTVKTFAEYMRRSGGKYTSAVLMYIDASVTSAVAEGIKNQTVEYIGDSSGYQSYGVFYLLGPLKITSTGTITASTAVNMNTSNTCTVLEYSGTLSTGSIIRMADGVSANLSYWNMAACPTSGFYTTDPTSVGGAVPSVGDNYQELSLVSVDGLPKARSSRTYIVGVWLDVTDVPNGGFNEYFRFCRINNSASGGTRNTQGTRSVFEGSYFPNVYYTYGDSQFYGCGFGGELRVGFDSRKIYTQSCVHTAPVIIGSTSGSATGLFSSAAFDTPFIYSPSSPFAAKVTNGCSLFCVNSIGGETSSYGLVAQNGGQIYLSSSIKTPIVTSNKLWIGFSNLQLPELLSSAGGVLPAVSAMTSYAQLIASPFNGYCVSYQDGSKMAVI